MTTLIEAVFEKGVPRPYPHDYPETIEADFNYRPVPPKHVAIVQARIAFAGKVQPAPYPED